MKYPKAGDLQRSTASQLTGNPAPIHNPYEVHSASGLEGVFADQGDAEFHADELRREGVPGVVVQHRRKPSYQDRALVGRPLTEDEWRQRMMRDEAERLARIAPRSPTPEQIYDRFHADRAAGIHHGEKRGNPVDPFALERAALARRARLFEGVYPTGIVYADRSQEVDGDYKRIAFLPYSTLKIEWEPDAPAELRDEVEWAARVVIAQRGKDFPISASGQTVRLGKRNPLGRNPGSKRKR